MTTGLALVVFFVLSRRHSRRTHMYPPGWHVQLRCVPCNASFRCAFDCALHTPQFTLFYWSPANQSMYCLWAGVCYPPFWWSVAGGGSKMVLLHLEEQELGVATLVRSSWTLACGSAGSTSRNASSRRLRNKGRHV